MSGRISPEEIVLEKRPPPSDGPVEAAVVVVVPPRPSVKPMGAGCCGAVEVRTEPNVRPVPAGADEEVVAVVVREKGVAEAVGLLKAKLKPVDAAVVAWAPEGKYNQGYNLFPLTFQDLILKISQKYKHT